MKPKSYWLAWALAATIIVFGCGGVALAQVQGSTPCGDKSPPGHWKPCVSYPFSHHHPYHSATAPVGKPGAVGEAHQGVRWAPTAAYTPSPEMLKLMRKAEEYQRTHGGMTEAPPLDARRPRPSASPAPPGPVVPRGSGAEGISR